MGYESTDLIWSCWQEWGRGTVTKGKARGWTEEGGRRGGLGKAAGRKWEFSTLPGDHEDSGVATCPYPKQPWGLSLGITFAHSLSTPGLPAAADSTQGPSISSSPWPWWPGRKLQRPGPPGSLSITPPISKETNNIQFGKCDNEIHQTPVKLWNVPRGREWCSLYKELVYPCLILTVISNYADHEVTETQEITSLIFYLVKACKS